MSRDAFAAESAVSRETLARLAAYAALLIKWQPKINLVGPATMADLWRRHMLDSTQLLPLLPEVPPGRPRRIVDLGSGAGFPGLVLSIMGAGEVHLVESDQRKCAFLREAARISGADVTIHASRIETLPPLDADVITARALAPLEKLLAWAAPHQSAHTIHIFPKGKEAEAELTKAAAVSKLEVTRHPSRTDPAATIFRIRVTDHD
ncbi:16S rRNA (guanine(527)-N(7))-methyltransferase RsmG [Zavarzinia compransoris]|uniref:16S rRNA (guanine(527)-N(7))-methyltransferase RsmG n=1 Tax=Zavarzinia marina TaxID=2911065 RepID=UPI001F2E1524|nr:16S rRNA (guanine(527)-N(7))-methyltransferase RsmG [Zavarzinia marina]MCF4166819.1 16S rRNA (guanine(527)-N(7))-methyltransferase RsmG [Zavarzinia marina]